MISVVVIGRNEAERLRKCLESVRELRLPEGEAAEIVYVDSASADGSVAIAETLADRIVPLRGGPLGAARARNAGASFASGDWILFLDGDTVVDPDFALRALAAASPKDAAVWGHRRESRPRANFFHRVLDLDWVYPPGPSAFCGGDALIRRQALADTGGFNETLIAGEEPELCARLRGAGWRILHIDAPMTAHDLAISRWPQYWNRAVRAGYAYANLSRRTRGLPQPLWQAESRANVRRAVLWLVVVLLSSSAATLTPSFWPLLAALAMISAASARSAWRARWKSDDAWSLLCYGFHSHLQQIPIFTGQCACWWDQTRSRRRELIEYN